MANQNVQSAELGIVAPVPKGEWSGSETYQKLNIVSYNGKVFIAILQNTNVTPGIGTNWDSYWMELVGSPSAMGTWNSTTTYENLNIVTNNGSAYIAKEQNTNIEPGVTSGWETYWTLLISSSYGSSGTYTITSSAWSNNAVSFTIPGTTGDASESVIMSGATISDAQALSDAEIFVSTSGSTITFTAYGTVPVSDVTLNYYISR